MREVISNAWIPYGDVRGQPALARGQLWHEDSFELNGSEIRWQAKVCEKHSEFGIDGGRILKLWVSQLPPGDARYWQEVASYDRGWCTRPLTPEAKTAVEYVVDMFR